jgi:hypothetical protein
MGQLETPPPQQYVYREIVGRCLIYPTLSNEGSPKTNLRQTQN